MFTSMVSDVVVRQSEHSCDVDDGDEFDVGVPIIVYIVCVVQEKGGNSIVVCFIGIGVYYNDYDDVMLLCSLFGN